MRLALLQITSGQDPTENARVVAGMANRAAADGAEMILTPEVTNCVSGDRDHQRAVLSDEPGDATLMALREVAKTHSVTVLIGSLAIKVEGEDRFANRSFLIGPDGTIKARYDKIHMFDVDVSETETYRESAHFRPGNRMVLADAAGAKIGLSICYDVRFPHLYRALAKAGAEVLTIPAAFSTVTGAAHWETLLRARAIETGCFVVAPAQTGLHYEQDGKARRTYGHSMVVNPWGEVLLNAGAETGIFAVDIDLAQVTEARRRVPSLSHDRDIAGPL